MTHFRVDQLAAIHPGNDDDIHEHDSITSIGSGREKNIAAGEPIGILSKDEAIGILSKDRAHSVSSSMASSHLEQEPENARRKAAADERRTLGKRETRAITCLRLVVFLFLIIIAGSTSASVYFLGYDREEDAFTYNFGFYADQVIQKFSKGIEQKMSAIDTLSVDITSHAIEADETFPFVTVPNFEYKGSNARIGGDAIMAFYMPYITEGKRLEWEDYTDRNSQHIVRAWREETRQKDIQDTKYGLESPEIGDGFGQEALDAGLLSDEERKIPTEIWFPDEVDNAERLPPPYFPVWQMSPLLPPEVDLINMDFSRVEMARNSIFTTLNTGKASVDHISTFTDDLEDGESAAVFDLLIQAGQHRHGTGRYEGDPLSSMTYPVFDTFREDKQVVGILFSTLYWRFLFSNVLPDNINGVVCVVGNSLNQSITYEINGNDVIFLGEGDRHDPSFDRMEESIDVAQYMREASRPETRSFTMVDLDNDYLNYTLRVYPSDTFEEIYVTGEAVYEAVGVAIFFACVIVLFVVYDFCVQRRQSIVMDRAVRATAVISSLYPDAIRDQIINDEANDVVKKKLPYRNAGFLKSAVEKGGAPPIATKYPDCSVYFADLAGFTKWSSTREPEQVFQLLEALFKEFDDCALRRGVYKVETIGDCYLAVTGLPQTQPDHATRMAKFAMDCQAKLEQVTTDLFPTLGEGTDDLTLRTGIHSGPVTAGVLRGEKGRFQLFGDTVNTASRMESTGVPRKIQVSQATADALITEGKEGWLIPREEKVFAKGKGEVQTYFLQIKGDRASSKSRTTTSDSTNATPSIIETASTTKPGSFHA